MKRAFVILLLATSTLVSAQARPVRKSVSISNNWNRKSFKLDLEEESDGHLSTLVIKEEGGDGQALITFSDLKNAKEKCFEGVDLLGQGGRSPLKVLCFELDQDFSINHGGALWLKFLHQKRSVSKKDIRFMFALSVERDGEGQWRFYLAQTPVEKMQLLQKTFFSKREGLSEILVNQESVMEQTLLVP